MIIDDLRRGLVQFNTVAGLLDLRRLLFQACRERLNFLLPLSGSRLKILLLLGDGCFQLLDLRMFLEQRRGDLLFAAVTRAC